MGKLIISLISDQTIPNIIFLKDHSDYDKLLFISTAKMERSRKVEAIVNTLKIDNSIYDKIIVNQESIIDIRQKLDNYFSQNTFNNIILNITGGTKFLAIAVFNYINSNFNNPEVFYIPFPRNECINLSTINEKQLNTRLKVEEYLSSYQLKINTNIKRFCEKQQKPFEREAFTTKLMSEYMNYKDTLKEIYNVLNPYRSTKKPIPIDDDVKKMLTIIDYSYKETLNKDEINYLTGGWFEEYIFISMQELKKELDEPLDVVISCDMSLTNTQSKATFEIDVIFTFQNKIFHIECKSLDFPDEKSTDLINSIIYKSSALQKPFGLGITTVLAATDPRIYDFCGRAEFQNISLLGPNELNKDAFKNKIKELLNIKECINVQTS